MLHLWFHYKKVGGHPTKGEREWTPPIKTNGKFGSSIGRFAKEENHGNKSNCCEWTWWSNFYGVAKKVWIVLESLIKGIQVIGNHYSKTNGQIERV